MANKNYKYRQPQGSDLIGEITQNISPAAVVVLTDVKNTAEFELVLTVDETAKADLDSAMELLNFVFVAEVP